jgi:DNA invertase Pin-like site-specific DNA recombinase
MKRGYARVSTQDQDLERQLYALREAGCGVIYQEKQSGGRRNRLELDRMLREMEEGDVVVIQKLDRIGRSLQHLLELVEEFKRRKVSFISLSEGFDTTTAHGLLFFSIVGAMAEYERSIIRERTRDGLAVARRAGKRIGRPGVGGEVVSVVLAGVDQGDSIAEIARRAKVSRHTVYKIIRNNSATR